ncbi:MAG: hypothetical protein Q7R94_02345 [bacterium]|nr:hypothetical protein [bacterium]
MSKEGAEKKNYELAVLLRDEESSREVLKLLGQHQIEVQETGQPKKINLSYPVKHIREAIFEFFSLFSLPENIKLLEQDLKGNTAILRSMVVGIPRDRAAARGMVDSRRRVSGSRRPASPSPSYEVKPVPHKATLSNEAIEKKIEEILQ